MLVAPSRAAARRVRGERSGAAASSAAHGSPARLGGAQMANAMTPTNRRHRDGPPGAGMLRGVPLDVGNQRELARPLDGGRELALVPRAHPRQAARQNLPALGEEAAQRAVILVVEHARAGLAHGTGLGGAPPASSSSISSASSGAAMTAATAGLGWSRAACTTRERRTAY